MGKPANNRNKLNVARMTRRLVALHADCSASDLASGLAWYDRARAAADAIAIDGDVVRAASVIAHLSPRARWNVNVAWAARVLEAAASGAACPAVHTGAQRAKAWAVATGAADPFVGHGRKTSAFLAGILGERSRVCVDSWAARAATGLDLTKITPAQYRDIEMAYQRAAESVGMAPRDLQAAIWVHVRGSAE